MDSRHIDLDDLKREFLAEAGRGFDRMFGEDLQADMVTFDQRESRSTEIGRRLNTWLLGRHIEADACVEPSVPAACPRCGKPGKPAPYVRDQGDSGSPQAGSASDRSASDRTRAAQGSDRSASDRPASDRPASDRAASDRPTSDRARATRGSDRSASDRERSARSSDRAEPRPDEPPEPDESLAVRTVRCAAGEVEIRRGRWRCATCRVVFFPLG